MYKILWKSEWYLKGWNLSQESEFKWAEAKHEGGLRADVAKAEIVEWSWPFFSGAFKIKLIREAL